MHSSILENLELLINEIPSSSTDGFEMSVEPENEAGKVNEAYTEPLETDFDVENGDKVQVKLFRVIFRFLLVKIILSLDKRL